MNTKQTPEILPVGMDEARYGQMQEEIERVLHMNEENKMVEPIQGDRGGLMYFCKNQNCTEKSGAYTPDYDPETSYTPPVCPSCGGNQVSLGTGAGISSYFHTKH